MVKIACAWGSAALLALSLGLMGWAAAHDNKKRSVPEDAKKLKNPVTPTEASLGAAKSIYEQDCAKCHGQDGKGEGPEAAMYDVQPADFTNAQMMGEMTDGEIFYIISEGRRPMPAYKKRLTDEQRWQLVNYVRTFAPKPAKDTRSRSTPANKKNPPQGR